MTINQLKIIIIISSNGVYGKNIKVPSGFEGNVILEVFNYDKQVFGDYSFISIVV